MPAVPELVLIQFPPGRFAVICAVPPWHTALGPVMVGDGFTVTVVLTLQLVGVVPPVAML